MEEKEKERKKNIKDAKNEDATATKKIQSKSGRRKKAAAAEMMVNNDKKSQDVTANKKIQAKPARRKKVTDKNRSKES
jgi:hypothetical protein